MYGFYCWSGGVDTSLVGLGAKALNSFFLYDCKSRLKFAHFCGFGQKKSLPDLSL